MEQNNRLKPLVLTLMAEGIVENQQDFGEKLGYPKATISSIISGRLPISDKFIRKLKSVYPNVNTDWLMTGEGEMLIKDGQNAGQGNSGGINQQNVHGPNTATNVDSRFIEIFQEQTRQLTTAQQQITDLITIIKQGKQ